MLRYNTVFFLILKGPGGWGIMRTPLDVSEG